MKGDLVGVQRKVRRNEIGERVKERGRNWKRKKRVSCGVINKLGIKNEEQEQGKE